MSLEKGSSLDQSRMIKKIILGSGRGYLLIQTSRILWKSVENHSITKWGKCHSRKWKWPFPHSRFEHFRKTKTTYIDQIYPQLVGEMFSETNFLWCMSKNVKFHCGPFFKSGCMFQLHVKNATFLVKMLVMSSNICYILFTFTFFSNRNKQSERLKKYQLIKISIRLERKSEKVVNMYRLIISSIDKIINW